MVLRSWFAAAALTAGTVFGAAAPAVDAVPTVAKPIYTFGTLRTAPADAAKAKAKAWLQSINKLDDAALNAVWADETKSVFDRTIATFTLGDAAAAQLLHDAKDADTAAPTTVPALFKDAKSDPFFRTNMATAYARALAGKRVYEEALDALKVVPPELAVDPAAYFFYRAVTEHALMEKDAAMASIVRLLDDVADAPDRYKMVATLMFFEMQNWSADQKDLANIGRLMDNSGRRLELARPGTQTQDIQKKIVFRLDEKIKELENQCKGNCNGGACPNGGQPGQGGATPTGPQADSFGGGGGGKGVVDDKKLKKLAEEWGKLPPAERAKAIAEISKDLPAKYKPMIEEYAKSLNKLNPAP